MEHAAVGSLCRLTNASARSNSSNLRLNSAIVLGETGGLANRFRFFFGDGGCAFDFGSMRRGIAECVPADVCDRTGNGVCPIMRHYSMGLGSVVQRTSDDYPGDALGWFITTIRVCYSVACARQAAATT